MSDKIKNYTEKIGKEEIKCFTFSSEFLKNIMDYFLIERIIRHPDNREVIRLRFKKDKEGRLIDMPLEWDSFFDEIIESDFSISEEKEEIKNKIKETINIMCIQVFLTGFLSYVNPGHREKFEKYLDTKVPEYIGLEYNSFYIGQQIIFDQKGEGLNG